MLSKSAQVIQDFLSSRNIEAQVIELPASTRTTDEAARAIGCQPAQIVKSLIFKTKYTESDSRIGRWQGGAQSLSQAQPMPKQPNLKRLGDAGGLKICGCPTTPEPILESRAV